MSHHVFFPMNEHNLGRAAADMVGYITGNLPGAYAADKAFELLYHNKNSRSRNVLSFN